MTVDVQQIISDAAQRVTSFTESFNSAASAALNTSAAFSITPFTANSPGAGYRPPYQATANLSHEFLATYNDALRDMKPEFSDALSTYIAQWFPECVTSSTNSWICNTILTGGTGLPPGIEEAIWERTRGREAREAGRLEQEALTQGAARGFMIPPGAITYRMLQVQQDSVNRASTANRDEALKHIDIIIENVRFAVAEGVKVRGQVIGALGDFIRAHFMPEQLALQKAEGILKAKGMLMSSAADYYRAAVAEAQLNVEAQNITGRSYDAANSAAASVAQSFTNMKGQVAASIASTYGSAAAGAASSILGVGQEQAIRTGLLTA